jgi:hypothetical protein
MRGGRHAHGNFPVKKHDADSERYFESPTVPKDGTPRLFHVAHVECGSRRQIGLRTPTKSHDARTSLSFRTDDERVISSVLRSSSAATCVGDLSWSRVRRAPDDFRPELHPPYGGRATCGVCERAPKHPRTCAGHARLTIRPTEVSAGQRALQRERVCSVLSSRARHRPPSVGADWSAYGRGPRRAFFARWGADRGFLARVTHAAKERASARLVVARQSAVGLASALS